MLIVWEKGYGIGCILCGAGNNKKPQVREVIRVILCFQRDFMCGVGNSSEFVTGSFSFTCLKIFILKLILNIKILNIKLLAIPAVYRH